MKKKLLLKALFLCFFITKITANYSQSTGDIAFTAFNSDGDKDFSIVTLASISANSTIYFTDRESIEPGDFNTGEGTLVWTTGGAIINSGTIVVFTDIDNGSNLNFGASIGSLSRIGNFNIVASKDAIFAYTGVDEDTVTTFISAIQIGNDNIEVGDLTGTGLTSGSTYIIIDLVASPDGGYYKGSRSNQSSYANYLTLIGDDATNWTTTSSSGDGETFLPISKEAFTTSSTTWTGSTSSVWNLSGNWSNGVPTTDSYVTIPSTINKPVINSSMIAGNVNLSSGAALTISNNLSNKGITTLDSGTSLIVEGSLSGDITYTRGSLGTDWHLVSSPVVGETIQDVITNSSLATGTGSNIGLSTYNNSTPAWEYYTSSSTGTMASGAGYAIKVTSGDTSFTGTIPTADVSATTTDGSNGWNLIGNPYPSYIAVNNNADASNRLMGSVADFDSSYAAIYFWDAATSAYIAENNTTNARFVAPGQGFFVKVNSGVSSIAITEAMQSHQSSEEFSRTVDTSPKVILTVADGNVVKTTTLKYFDTTNTGLDIGYDAGAFNGGAESAFKLNTHLVSDSQGIEFTLQALSTEGYETSIVPVSFTADAGKKVIFTSTIANLPEGMMVFLEDRQADVFTRLDEVGTNYTTTLAANEAGIGRFYLHTSVENRLGVDTVDFANVSIYATDANTVRITGLTATTANIQIFDVLGRQLLDQRFEANMVNDIAVPNLVKAGVYLVKVNSATGSITKKILFN